MKSLSNETAPKPAWFRSLRSDFSASIVVFLVALPLCLGIALASDAPLFAGIITGAVAGIVVSLISGSELSVSGPAAGLTVIVAGAIGDIGSYEGFLVAVVLSGIFQIVLGFLKAGAIASLFPLSVIKGMLAAIGLTIILKQIPHALGGAGAFESDMRFFHWLDEDSTVNQLVAAFQSLHMSAVIIAGGCLGLLILWESKIIRQNAWLSKVPGALVAVVTGALLNQVFHLNFPHVALHANDGHLVQLPEIDSVSSILAQLRFPSFGFLANSKVWIWAATIACIGSIETLLCLESTDKLDPERRVSNPNQELLAQGTGNILAGLIGGIPMTSVIVRSSANIYAGARTRLSSFFHGVILLASALALVWILNMIPLASLASVLLLVGYKLAHPSLFKKMYKRGWDNFIPFVVTVAAILTTDLLKGVVIGVLVGLGFVIKTSFYSAIMAIRDGKEVMLRFMKDVTFIHKAKLRKELGLIEPGSSVLIDGSRALFIDQDIMEMLQDFEETAPERGIRVTFKGVAHKQRPPVVAQPIDQEKADGLTPKTVVGQ